MISWNMSLVISIQPLLIFLWLVCAYIYIPPPPPTLILMQRYIMIPTENWLEKVDNSYHFKWKFVYWMPISVHF
jgi:hypothetical protein